MSQSNKGTFKTLWEMKHLSVDDFLQKIAVHPDLKFLLSTVGAWFLLRWMIGIWMGAHVLYFVFRVFRLVLG